MARVAGSLRSAGPVSSIPSRGCAARCCSGRSLKCRPTRWQNQMTNSAHVALRRWRAAAIAITRDHRVAGWPAALDPRWRRNQLGSRRIAFRPSVLPVSGSPARQLSVATRGCRCSPRQNARRTATSGRGGARTLRVDHAIGVNSIARDVPATPCRTERFLSSRDCHRYPVLLRWNRTAPPRAIRAEGVVGIVEVDLEGPIGASLRFEIAPNSYVSSLR